MCGVSFREEFISGKWACMGATLCLGMGGSSEFSSASKSSSLSCLMAKSNWQSVEQETLSGDGCRFLLIVQFALVFPYYCCAL